jgi:hypothetical protein
LEQRNNKSWLDNYAPNWYNANQLKAIGYSLMGDEKIKSLPNTTSLSKKYL